MSEYGCITNQRTFAETAGLYQTDMTAVFSGGLVYEYSEEGNGYGLVNIKSNSVTPVGSQFSDLQQELAKAPVPSGSGGYSPSNPEQDCPGQSDNWDTKPYTGSALPAMPSGADKYMKSGAGSGPGLSGSGSQNAPGGSTVTASSGAGSVTATYGSGPTGGVSGNSSSGAAAASSSSAAGMTGAPMDIMPVVMCGVVVVISFVFGVAVL